MCKFHILGCCSRGNDCNFAHDPGDMNPLPDLTRTKLCKTLINTGSCDDPECKYAHNKDELRGTPPPLPKSATAAREGLTPLCVDAAPGSPLHAASVDAIGGVGGVEQAMQSGMLQAGMMQQWSSCMAMQMAMMQAAHAQAIAAQIQDSEFTPASMLASKDSPQVSPWSTPISTGAGLDGVAGKGRDGRSKGRSKGSDVPSPSHGKGEKERDQKVLVKNTFITCEEEFTPKPLRMIHSAAGRLNMLSRNDDMSEDGDESHELQQVLPDERLHPKPSMGLPAYAPLPESLNISRITGASILDGPLTRDADTSLLSEMSHSASNLVRSGTWGGTSLATLAEETHPKLGEIEEDYWENRQVSGAGSDATTGVPSTERERTEKRVQDTPLHVVAEAASRRSQSSLDSPRSQGLGSSDEEAAAQDDDGGAGAQRGPLPEVNSMRGLAVKNTFLEFEAPPAPLRSIQTAAGRLDRWGATSEESLS